MDRISFTLVTEGTSHKALIPHLTWLLEQNGIAIPIDSEWADWRFLPTPPKGLSEKIKTSIELYPCDILFVHRDSDSASIEDRETEINQALVKTFGENRPLYVCVIPVRMLESWLLFDENAIRRASANPLGKVPLDLPKIKQIEGIARPKELLENTIIRASELQGRHLRKLNLSHCKAQISQNIKDFSPLRGLSAFVKLENDIINVVNSLINQ